MSERHEENENDDEIMRLLETKMKTADVPDTSEPASTTCEGCGLEKKLAKNYGKMTCESCYTIERDRRKAERAGKKEIVIDVHGFFEEVKRQYIANRSNRRLKVLYNRGVKPAERSATARDEYIVRYTLEFLAKNWKKLVLEK
jgi:hypothetical protein